MRKFTVGRNPYPDQRDDIEVISFEELEERCEKLEGFGKDRDSPYRSDQTKALRKLGKIGFEHLAWTPRVRHLYYNPEIDVLIKDIEGDLFYIENPTDEYLDECLSHYPKAEVSVGEKYDSRFD